jgi:hypothetical protein
MHSNTPSLSTSPAVTITEVPLQPISGWGKLWQGLLLVASPAVIIPALILAGMPLLIPFLIVPAVIAGILVLCGLMAVGPNEARVCTLFGEYVGTVRQTGFFWANPFYTKRPITLLTLDTSAGVTRP